MKRRTLCHAALSLTALAATAAIPVAEEPVSSVKTAPGLMKSPAMGATARENTFFEGFEERPAGFGNYSDNWLPDGWTKFSNAGTTIPTDNTRHNLLWRVTTNDDKNVALVIDASAYEGNCFAHIIADVAYETGQGYHEPDFQDEWLVTPAVTPVNEDWLYFKLHYNPGWMVYNRDNNDFSARNTDMEVYVTTDDGANWVKLWNLIDNEITPGYTQEELRASLSAYGNQLGYRPIYVNLADYVGQQVKIAFRFFGRMGHGVALDNVAVGVPMPVASYTLPGGVFMQQISPAGEYPAAPRLLAPHGVQFAWRNTSTDILRNTWTYSDATGAIQTSDAKHLVTPAYEFNTVHMTPELQGFFESRESEPYHTNFPEMQIGGILSGSDDQGAYTGQFAAGLTDVFDGRIVVSPEYISLNPDIDLAWEKIQGYMDGTLDVYGYCSVYPKPTVPYGFDYIDLVARVDEAVPATDGIEIMVFALNEETGQPETKIGQTVLWGSDIPAPTGLPTSLRFQFPAPVNADQSIMILMMGCRTGGHVSFPYMKTTHPEKYGNNLVYWIHYDNDAEDGYYDEFKNLGTFPLKDGHFGGLCMGMGVTYSTMERLDSDIFEISAEGGSKEFTVKATQTPDKWVLTEDGITPADWAHFTATHDENTDTYTVTLTADANTGDARECDLILASPGSYVTIPTRQAAGLGDTLAENKVTVKVAGDDIIVSGGRKSASVYDVAGRLVATAALDGTTAINARGLAKGAYVVVVDGTASFKVVK